MKKHLSQFIIITLIISAIISTMVGAIACNQSASSIEEDVDSTDGTSVSALTLIKGTESKSYTLDDIKSMSAEEGWGGIMNSSGVISGPFKQKGVSLTSLLDNIGGIGTGDAVRITAKDGYSMTYSYDQVINGNFTTLDCSNGEEVSHGKLTVILAYEEDGVLLDDQRGPLRIAILNSNTQVTEGHWWIKWVTSIEIVAMEQSWSLQLLGVINEDIDNATFESGAAPNCHAASWTDDDGHLWEGIPLWLLVGRVDDEDSHSEESQAFNDAVADVGYEVEVIAADGYSKTFTSEEVRRNNDMIIAFRCDEEPLEEGVWPLRLVGSNLTKGQMVSQIATIKLVLPENMVVPEPEWTLHLDGVLSEDVTDSYFAAALADCHSASWTDDEGHVWEGIPLWLFVGRVDDDFKHNPNESGAFNDDAADAGYDVEVIAVDGYSKTFTSIEVKRNDNMIIASICDGEPLDEESSPLRLVGPDLTKGQMVSQIIEIKVIFPD